MLKERNLKLKKEKQEMKRRNEQLTCAVSDLQKEQKEANKNEKDSLDREQSMKKKLQDRLLNGRKIRSTSSHPNNASRSDVKQIASYTNQMKKHNKTMIEKEEATKRIHFFQIEVTQEKKKICQLNSAIKSMDFSHDSNTKRNEQVTEKLSDELKKTKKDTRNIRNQAKV